MNLILSVPVCAPIPMWRINKLSALQGLAESAAMFSFMMWYFPQKRDGSTLRPEMWGRERERGGVHRVRTDQFHPHPISLPNPSETQYPGSCWVRETDTENAAAWRCLSNPIQPRSGHLFMESEREWETNMNQVGRNTCTNENSGMPGKEVIDSVCYTIWNKTHCPAHSKCAGLRAWTHIYVCVCVGSCKMGPPILKFTVNKKRHWLRVCAH